MGAELDRVELFQSLNQDDIRRLSEIARHKTLSAGEYLFFLGDTADSIYVVTDGTVELCFPMSLQDVIKDITVESAKTGETLGWSALVKPYRFTLSARAAEPTAVAAFTREDLQKLFDDEPRIGCALHARLSELVGIRLLKMQALWVRELQRTLAAEVQRREE